MRSDAARNRARLLDVAAERFATAGFDVPLEEIATQAGVGIATLYRHYPSREALVLALVESKLRPIAEYTLERADRADDPVGAFVEVMEFSAQRHTTDRALCQLWRTVDDDVINEAARQNGLFAATERLLDNARRAGGVADDVTVFDVARTFYAVAGVIEAGHADSWDRFLRIHLRGMLTRPDVQP